MQYRRLGRTNLRVSAIGIGCGYLSAIGMDDAVRIFERALDAGVNYFDGRYGDSNAKLAKVLKGRRREELIIASKTVDTTGKGAKGRVMEDLRDLQTDYIDIYQVKAHNYELLNAYLAPEGAVDGLEEARDEGLIRFIGVTGHSHMNVLADAIRSGRFDTVLFPLNFAQLEALTELVPLAQRMDVGMIVMKPLATGLLPTGLALRWLMDQPIATAVPGVSTLKQLERDIEAVQGDATLSLAEQEEMKRIVGRLEGRICRGCDELCQPCPEGIANISWLIAHDVLYNHYRNMGLEEFINFTWGDGTREALPEHFSRMYALAQKCTKCGDCERRCPYGVKVVDMLSEQTGSLRGLLGVVVSS